MEDVIVMGSNYSLTLGVVRSLGEAGYNVRLLVSDPVAERIAGKSKYVTRCINCNAQSAVQRRGGPLQAISKLGTVLTGKKTKKSSVNFKEVWPALERLRGSDEHMLVIPVSDPYCIMLDEHAEQLSDHYYIPNIDNKPGELIRFMDKMEQKKLAGQCGLKTAYGNIFNTGREGIEKAVREVTFPCFVKVLVSANTGDCKNLHTVCNNGADLRSALEKARAFGCETVLAEDYLKIDKELCVYGVAGNGRVFMPGCLETLRGGFGRHKGVTVEGNIISSTHLGEVKQNLEEFVKRSGLTGLFCIDIIQSKDSLFFVEMNLRSGASVYGVTLAGINLPGTLANIVYQKSGSDKKLNDIQRTVHFLSEMIELDTYVDGFISRKEYKNHMTGNSERFIKNEADPAPWKEFQKLAFQNETVKWLRYIKGQK